jgi:VIT1/CCC1 family predicted Fe2+/Mn2+ transporter
VQDWYRTIGLTLAWVALLGVAVGLAASLLLMPEWLSRISLTAAGLALAFHIVLSVALSRTPRLEA